MNGIPLTYTQEVPTR